MASALALFLYNSPFHLSLPSLYLFKLGLAPQIQDLYGKVDFTGKCVCLLFLSITLLSHTTSDILDNQHNLLPPPQDCILNMVNAGC